MAEPKIKTLQARFGFADPDLKKTDHDEIIKWLDVNIEDVLMTVFSLPGRPKNIRTEWEPLVRTKPDEGQFIGYIDLAARQKSRDDDLSPVLFEAKTVLGTLGELFRQLQTYRAGYLYGWSLTKCKIVVVCPDDSEAETIRQQGYHFLKYDPKMVFPAGGV